MEYAAGGGTVLFVSPGPSLSNPASGEGTRLKHLSRGLAERGWNVLGLVPEDVADERGITRGTARMTVAGAAVYAADRLTDGKAVTQAEVVRAVSETVPASKWKIANYSGELHDASERRHQPTMPVSGLVADD